MLVTMKKIFRRKMNFTYGGAAIDSGATHDCVAYFVDEDF